MNKNIISVKELNGLIKFDLENNEVFKNIYVTGEIANLTFNKSGHIYFSIKDEFAIINCMIWKDKANSFLKLKPTEGMKVVCNGKVSFYAPYGKISFEVWDVRIDGIGALQLLFSERKSQLEAQGWFDQSIKKPLPSVIKNVGIITAESGAAIHDLITTIQRRMSSINIYFFPSQVQGNEAKYELAKKIGQANSFNIKLDVLIVGRGGGSYEDLWCFNEMEVLTAIRASNIPIVSAIGHEPDITLADYVSDLRAPTPTAAGELVSRDQKELIKNLVYLRQTLVNKLEMLVNNKTSQLNSIINQIDKNITSVLNWHENTIKRANQDLKTLINRKINTEELQLKNLDNILTISNPMLPLAKGYAILSSIDGSNKLDFEQLKPHDKLKIITNKNTIISTIERIIDNGK